MATPAPHRRAEVDPALTRVRPRGLQVPHHSGLRRRQQPREGRRIQRHGRDHDRWGEQCHTQLQSGWPPTGWQCGTHVAPGPCGGVQQQADAISATTVPRAPSAPPTPELLQDNNVVTYPRVDEMVCDSFTDTVGPSMLRRTPGTSTGGVVDAVSPPPPTPPLPARAAASNSWTHIAASQARRAPAASNSWTHIAASQARRAPAAPTRPPLPAALPQHG